MRALPKKNRFINRKRGNLYAYLILLWVSARKNHTRYNRPCFIIIKRITYVFFFFFLTKSKPLGSVLPSRWIKLSSYITFHLFVFLSLLLLLVVFITTKNKQHGLYHGPIPIPYKNTKKKLKNRTTFSHFQAIGYLLIMIMKLNVVKRFASVNCHRRCIVRRGTNEISLQWIAGCLRNGFTRPVITIRASSSQRCKKNISINALNK